MDELYGDGSFANCRGGALHGTVPNIAGNEDTGHT
jgi:hypothetical protein